MNGALEPEHGIDVAQKCGSRQMLLPEHEAQVQRQMVQGKLCIDG